MILIFLMVVAGGMALFIAWFLNPQKYPPFASMPKPPWFGAEAPAYTKQQAQWLNDIRCRGCVGTVKTDGVWAKEYATKEVDLHSYRTRYGSQIYGLTDTPRYFFCERCAGVEGLLLGK